MVVDFSSWVSEDVGSNHVEVIVPTIENWVELSIRVCFSFFFQGKSGTKNNHRTGLGVITY